MITKYLLQKKVLQVLILNMLFVCVSNGQIKYEDYFSSKSLRIDFHLAGNSNSTEVIIEQLKREPFWSGPVNNLIDPFNYGSYRLEVIDSVSGNMIYSKGFSTLYQEWQTTAEAKVNTRSFFQVIRIPFPRNTVEFRLFARNKNQLFNLVFKKFINPNDYFITKEDPDIYSLNRIIYAGDPASHVDLVFLPEGYSAGEMGKFMKDVKRFSESLMDTAPFNEYRKEFNIWSVEAPSQDSGTDIPGEGIYKNSIFNFSFYTFDLPRYLTSYDLKTIRDVAANAPYDHIIVLINSERYGGGGIYNHYTATTTDHELSPIVLVHELGHGFGGLADEYYSSDVAYEEFYDLSREPWEPNITTLVDFESKWKNRIEKEIPVPTPDTEDYMNVVGVFEGGGYVAKGVYRPFIDCRMKSNEAKGFCPVCQDAIVKMIRYYIGEEL